MSASILQQALALHRSGNLTAAAALCHRVLAAEPDNPAALHSLGLIAYQSARYEEAADLIRQAIARRSAPTYWYNLAHVHLALKDAAQAEEAFRQTIARAPRHAEALFQLGNLAARSEDPMVARDYYRRAIEARPGFVEAHVNLGLLLDRTGDTKGAVAALEQALRLRPDDPEILNSLGAVRRSVSRAGAIADFQSALSLNPEHPQATVNLAKSLAAKGRHAEAVELLDSVLDRRPEDADARMVLANSLAELNRFEEAIQHYRLATATMPRLVRPLVGLRNLYLRLGRFEDAYLSCIEIRELDPRNTAALVGIMRYPDARVPKEEAERVARLAADASLPISDRRQLHFALSSHWESAGDYDAAFMHMERGHQLRRIDLERQYRPYDAAEHIARTDRIIEAFNEDYFRRVAGFGVASDLPVFVVGMPRSGTTLCEQILASHSKVYGAGEVPYMRAAERKLIDSCSAPGTAGDHLGYVAQLTSSLVRSLAERQLARLRKLAPTALRVVDKMPDNLDRLGLIATLFPGAKIVHCRRDPMDTGLSCFSKDFASFPLWISDLRSIGQVYRQYERLMGHWRHALPIPIFEFQYETVVSDFESSARRLIRYCGLDWENACLEFYRTERQVKTASLEQVRRPIYDTSIGRWRKFEQYLAPLRKALDGA
jgi:tetratricopeptide (TPR) repeat protein